MCKYCEEHELSDGDYGIEFMSERQLSKHSDSYTGIDMRINQENELKIFAVVDNAYVKALSFEKIIKINYCPMCGRKLDKEG